MGLGPNGGWYCAGSDATTNAVPRRHTPGVLRFELRVAVAADGEKVPRVEPLRRIVVPLHQVMHLGGGPRVAYLAEGVIRPHEER
jgi:hypothetical protein